MLIGILLVLGIGAAGILVLLIGLMVVKRIKTMRHPAVFKARVRITDGQFPGVKGTWKKCYGAWVTTVFTTRKGLPLSITDVLPLAGHAHAWGGPAQQASAARVRAPAPGCRRLGPALRRTIGRSGRVSSRYASGRTTAITAPAS